VFCCLVDEFFVLCGFEWVLRILWCGENWYMGLVVVVLLVSCSVW